MAAKTKPKPKPRRNRMRVVQEFPRPETRTAGWYRRQREKQVVVEMTAISTLIKKFGLVLCGYQPGITALLAGDPVARGEGYFGEPISFTDLEWNWLKPLLEELAIYRAEYGDLRKVKLMEDTKP